MNKVYLLDTNIVSEFSKECPNQNVISLYEQRKDLCAISAVTWQELQYGLSKMPNGKRKSYIENCLACYRECLPVIAYDDFAAESFWVKVPHREKHFLIAKLKLYHFSHLNYASLKFIFMIYLKSEYFIF